VNAIDTARSQQISEMRNTAASIRKGIEKTTEQANDWQKKANEARKLVAVLEEKARLWNALADGMESGSFHDVAAPLTTGRNRPSNVDIHAVQERLMTDLPDLDAWSIHCGEMSAMLHKSAGGSRRAILGIAERYDIGYVEDRRGEQIHVAAEGKIDDIPVKIWCLLPAEDAEEQAVPVAEHFDATEAADVRQIEREMAIDAGDDSELDRQTAEDDARAERRAEAFADLMFDESDGAE
jgi:hypothetical protein